MLAFWSPSGAMSYPHIIAGVSKHVGTSYLKYLSAVACHVHKDVFINGNGSMLNALVCLQMYTNGLWKWKVLGPVWKVGFRLKTSGNGSKIASTWNLSTRSMIWRPLIIQAKRNCSVLSSKLMLNGSVRCQFRFN